MMMTFTRCMIFIQGRSQYFCGVLKRLLVTALPLENDQEAVHHHRQVMHRKSHESSTNYESHQRDKVEETNETLAKLEEKHGDKYSSEQLRTWANLIRLKKHSSLDTPPDYPFIRGRKKKQDPEPSADPKGSTSPK